VSIKTNGSIYVASNPSMPGLLKVGRTAKTANERMAELYSTGVPTRFEVELELRVADCHEAESLAHKALARWRESDNREFFRCSLEQAVRAIVPVVGDFSVEFANNLFGVPELIKKEQDKAERKEQRRLQDRLRRLREVESSLRTLTSKKKVDVIRLAELNAELQLLGPKPDAPEGPALIWGAYFPMPLGWMVWLGTLNIFGDSEEKVIGFICLVLLFFGYQEDQRSKKRDEEYEKNVDPFRKLEATIFELRESIDDLSVQERHLSDQLNAMENA
jgi:hypothetical protein